ncbi:MAG: glycosyltransferase [Candidatus Aenigmatarchaeota archaeon]
MKKHPLVSIIIPTFNSEKTIEKCLESIKSQTYKNIEIIVVDGGSKDKTVEIAQKMGAIVFIKKGYSMSASTNFGVKVSKGEYIYRVDSDVIVNPRLVEEALMKCEKEGYDVVCVFWLPDDSISFWAKVRRMEKESYIKYPNFIGSIRYDKNILGARFLKREVFEIVGGMDERVPTLGEDYAFYEKLAATHFRFATITAREIHLGEPRTISDVIKKQYHYGKSMKFYLKEKKIKRLKQISIIRIPLINNWRKLLRHPILALGFLFYTFVVHISTAIGFLVSITIEERVKR